MTPAAHHPPLSLTPRDLRILQFVYELEGVSIRQVARRFFGSGGGDGLSACGARLRKLLAAGLLAQLRLASTSGVGSGRYLIQLGKLGRKLLAEQLKIPRRELARNGAIHSPYTGSHHLAIGDVRLALELHAERMPGHTLIDWTGERTLRAQPTTTVVDPAIGQHGGSREIPLIPDAAFTLTTPHGTQRFLLELDMGTVPRARVSQKLRGYLIHAASEPTPILWVVPDRKRQADLVAWARAQAERLAGADPTIFWIAVFDAITPDSILSQPIWRVPGVAEPLALLGKRASGEQPGSFSPSGQLSFREGSGG